MKTVLYVCDEHPQVWQVLPVNGSEAADLVQHSGSLTEEGINVLGLGRRCLRRDHLKGKVPLLGRLHLCRLARPIVRHALPSAA